MLKIYAYPDGSYEVQIGVHIDGSGDSLYQYRADGSLKYAISHIQAHCTNVELGANGNSVTLTFKTTVTAEMPMIFLGVTVHVKKPISLKIEYTPRF